jgi:homoserine dehydrogenase
MHRHDSKVLTFGLFPPYLLPYCVCAVIFHTIPFTGAVCFGSESYVFSFGRGIDLTEWKDKLETKAEPANLEKFVHHLAENHFFPNRVLVDCTADTSVASNYYDWLKKGIHVITPNKKANSGPLDRVIILIGLPAF